eukprot:jgi/Undpi1/13180/HiC_scaffold_8.g02842.m1
MRSAKKRRTREANIAAHRTVAASGVPPDIDERLAALMGQLRHARRAVLLGGVAVQKSRKTVTSLTAKLSSVSDTSLRASTALHGAMRLTRRLARRLSTVIGALAVVTRAHGVALKRGDELERERDDARSSEQRLGDDSIRFQTALTVAQEIIDTNARKRLDAATGTADYTAVIPLHGGIAASMNENSPANDEGARGVVETALGQPASSGASSTAPSLMLDPLADDLSVTQKIADPNAKEKLDDAAATDSTAAVPLRSVVVVSMEADSLPANEVTREIVEPDPGQPTPSGTSPTATTPDQDSLRATIRVLGEKVGEQLRDIESMKTAAAEEGRAKDQAARHAILLEADCEDLEEENDRLLCRVHTLELREREATAKSAFDAAEDRDTLLL